MHISSNFYSALVSGSCENGHIVWKDKLPIFGVGTIFVRECYISIYNSIMAEDRKPRNLVTGVPGIGNSFFPCILHGDIAQKIQAMDSCSRNVWMKYGCFTLSYHSVLCDERIARL
jgi:hypothetical protein